MVKSQVFWSTRYTVNHELGQLLPVDVTMKAGDQITVPVWVQIKNAIRTNIYTHVQRELAW